MHDPPPCLQPGVAQWTCKRSYERSAAPIECSRHGPNEPPAMLPVWYSWWGGPCQAPCAAQTRAHYDARTEAPQGAWHCAPCVAQVGQRLSTPSAASRRRARACADPAPQSDAGAGAPALQSASAATAAADVHRCTAVR